MMPYIYYVLGSEWSDMGNAQISYVKREKKEHAPYHLRWEFSRCDNLHEAYKSYTPDPEIMVIKISQSFRSGHYDRPLTVRYMTVEEAKNLELVDKIMVL